SAARSALAAVEQRHDPGTGAGFTQSRKDPLNAVLVRLRAHVRHRIQRQGDIEVQLVGLAGGGFHADAGGDAGNHHLGDAKRFQARCQVGTGEDAPGPLGEDDVIGLSVQSAGRSPPRAGCSLRPGARPSTFTNTTGKRWRRNALASSPARASTGPIGCTVGYATMPFCRSMTSKAVCGSRMVMPMAVSSWELKYRI